jgi:hypothetical protein
MHRFYLKPTIFHNLALLLASSFHLRQSVNNILHLRRQSDNAHPRRQPESILHRRRWTAHRVRSIFMRSAADSTTAVMQSEDSRDTVFTTPTRL